MRTTSESKYKIPIAILFAIILIVGFIFIYFSRDKEVEDPISNSSTEGWETHITPEGVSFKYPKTFPTTYLHPVDWPPQVQILDEAFSCNEAGVEIERAGKTSLHTINGTTYCVTKVTEGAAGSTYTQYAYIFQKEEQLVLLTFTFKFVQCANYDEPQMTECLDERETFDIDPIIDEVARSVRVN